MWAAAYLVLAILVAIFLLRKREEPRGRQLRWRLVQLMILVWILLELRLVCR